MSDRIYIFTQGKNKYTTLGDGNEEKGRDSVLREALTSFNMEVRLAKAASTDFERELSTKQKKTKSWEGNQGGPAQAIIFFQRAFKNHKIKR